MTETNTRPVEWSKFHNGKLVLEALSIHRFRDNSIGVVYWICLVSKRTNLIEE